MHKLTSLFLYAFLADGLVSLTGLWTGHRISGLEGAIGVILLALALVVFGGMAFTPRLPKRILLPPLIFIGLNMIAEVIYGQRAEMSISITETVLAMGILIGFGSWSGRVWMVQDYTRNRPSFTWKNFAATSLLNGFLSVCLILLLALGFAQKARRGFEQSTGGYAVVRPTGISLQERRFQRGDKEVRLIGMMHVANGEFYDAVSKALPSNSTAVVIVEGFTDRQHRLSGRFGYSHLAGALGIVSQNDSSFSEKAMTGIRSTLAPVEDLGNPRVEFCSGDLDTSNFTEGTVRYLNALRVLLDSSSPKEFVENFAVSKKTFVEDSRDVLPDVLDKRNTHLMEEIDASLNTHSTVVVPWGAYHMVALQKGLQERGFVETKRVEHEALMFHYRPLVCLIALLDRIPKE